jgi:hypothetical protein
MVVLLGLCGAFWWAAEHDWFAEHGILQGVFGPGGQRKPVQRSTLVFRNPNSTRVAVRTAGGLDDSFEVESNGEAIRSVQAGVETTIRYHAPYSGLFRERDEEDAKVRTITVEDGGTEEITLELTAVKGAALESATLRFHNPYDVQVHVETKGGLTDSFEVKAKGTVEKPAKAGEATRVRWYAQFTTLFKETTQDKAKETECRPKVGEPEEVELVLTAAEGTTLPQAILYFHNPYETPVRVDTAGGLVDRFDVEAGATVERCVQAGVATTIRYHAPYSGLYAETAENPKVDKQTPVAGTNVPVELALTPKGRTGGERATLCFHNPGDTPVLVVAAGGLTDRFEVEAGATEERSAQAEVETNIRYYAPYSGLYEETADKPKATKTNPVSGGKQTVELVLTPKASPVGRQATLRLHNPNDAGVVVLLSGGRKDEIWLEPAKAVDVPVRPDVKTEIRCHANDGQYAENSPETAKISNVNPKGGEQIPVDLKLTKRAYPVVQLANGGSVALAVRVNGETFTLPGGGSKAIRVPANRKVMLEWEAGEEGYLEGWREIGPYDWNKRVRESIVPERQSPPSIRVRNVSRRAMTVTVTRSSDGKLVEEPFRLAGGNDRKMELPEAGAYRVQTQAIPDKRNDADQNPSHYVATDQVIECAWGKTENVDCTADLKRDPGDGSPVPDQGDWARDALVSKLTAAKMRVDEAWVAHSVDGAVEAIEQFLQDAGNFARHVDVDGIAGDAIPYRAWAQSVAAKRGVRNAEWQRIVAATEESGSWSEFFERFPTQDQRY